MVDLGTDKSLSTLFPAIVGQERLKRGLLALAVEDGLSGTLLRGEKGTAKSTAVRAMAALLPEQRVVADCPYGCPPPDATPAAGVTRCDDCQGRSDPPVETRDTPLVTLPLGATRDRVVGTLSVDAALAGEASFDPGLLARANRGVLYVDEVNLLEDHLVDILLDVAAAGVNQVERDGVSVRHPASVTLIGTMNPEEGTLRPQLRDRFDLCVEVTGSDDRDERVAILSQAVDSTTGNERTGGRADESPDESDAETTETAALAARVRAAQERRPQLPQAIRYDVADLCLDAGVEGHRADIAVARAARAFAALDGRSRVVEADVAEAARYGLAHRLRSRPFDDDVDLDNLLDDRFDERDQQPDDRDGNQADDGDTGERGDDGDTQSNAAGDGDEGRAGDGAGSGDGDREDDRAAGGDGADPTHRDGPGDEPRPGVERTVDRSEDRSRDSAGDADDSTTPDGERGDEERPARAGDGREASDGDDADPDQSSAAGDDNGDGARATPLVPGGKRVEAGAARAPTVDRPEASGGSGDGTAGRATTAPSATGRGATVRTEPADGTGSVDTAGTVREAARNGRRTPDESDLRQSVRTTETQTLTVFVADASASMAPAMRAAKGVALELLREAYTERDEVALVAVGGDDATTLVPPTDSVGLAARHLKDLPTADRTPLPSGLDAATALLDREEPDSALVVVLSDGRANVADGSPTAATRAAAARLGQRDATVLLVTAGESRAGLLDVIASATDADRIPLDALSSAAVAARR